jgi:hypothetical protein
VTVPESTRNGRHGCARVHAGCGEGGRRTPGGAAAVKQDGKVEATWPGKTGDAAAMRAIGEGGENDGRLRVGLREFPVAIFVQSG